MMASCEANRDRPPWRWSEHPITDLAGFLASISRFIDHWQLVKRYLRAQGRQELVLPDGTTRERLLRVFAAIPRRFAARDEALLALNRARAEHRSYRSELHRCMMELRSAAATLGLQPETEWQPVFDAIDAGGQRWVSVLDAAATCWGRWNVISGRPERHLILSGGLTVDEFRRLAEAYRQRGRAIRLAKRLWQAALRTSNCYVKIGEWAGRYRTFVRFRLGLPEALREPFPFEHPGSSRAPSEGPVLRL